MKTTPPPLLNNNKIYTVSEIEEWFNKNWHNYNWVADHWFCKKCPTRKRLPCICIEPDEQWKFLKLYEAIDVVLRFQRKEEYFKEEMMEYQNAKYSEINLKIWAAKNEKIGTEECESFSAKYLNEESGHGESNSLRVYGSSELELFVVNKVRDQLGRGGHKTKLDFEVFIQKEDFKYGIAFIKAFYEVFWVQNILPESIARIEQELDDNE